MVAVAVVCRDALVEELGGKVNTYYSTIISPIGELLLTSNAESLTGLYMEVRRHAPEQNPDWIPSESGGVLAEATAQLKRYFAGEQYEFHLPLAMAGTEFQKTVWRELTAIPYGATISYGELARRIGNPSASRAVGLANGRNPISIVVPCHRVIGSSGSLTGYGGGLDRKRILLALEAQVARRADVPAAMLQTTLF